MDINQICKDIKSLKIQGAISVAKAGADAFYFNFLENKNKKNLMKLLKISAKKLIKTRPTEPALRNVVSYYFYEIEKCNSIKDLEKHMKSRYNYIKNHFEDSKKKIMDYAYKKIKNNDVVYTHCHSSLVCDILIYAWRKGKRFTVYNTETRPLFQGRKTAKELSSFGIPVTHFVDSASRHAIRKADIIFLGVDAISTTKIYNKIGSETIAILASSFDVPVYFCSDSWKFDSQTIFGFDEEIEKRQAKEVWDNPPKNIKIYNYAFDQVSPKYVTGIISEIGVYEHASFVDIVRKNIEKINKNIL
jgi:ribose 1,5-bisphosphate isomerase